MPVISLAEIGIELRKNDGIDFFGCQKL
jgi:hypothetical protein